MNTTNTPKSIDNSVINFCKSIATNSVPEYIQLRPESWCIENECYNNVQQKVESFGGKRQLGWRIQVVPDPEPKFMIEAIHHAIWISKTGEKIDITPQPKSADKIVFVVDDDTKLEENKIGEKYHALLDCPFVNEFVQLCNYESKEYVSKTKLINDTNIPFSLIMKQMILRDKIIRKHGRK